MYSIVVMEKQFRRDGKYVEKLGYYQPTLKDDDPFRLSMDKDKYEAWKAKGAQPSNKVKKLAAKLGFEVAPVIKITPKKSAPKKKAQERAEAKG